MSNEEAIKYFKNLTTVTRRNNTKDLEVGVEISVGMAEELISIIEEKEEEIIDVKRENYRLRKENFELIQDNNKLQTEKGMLREKLLETTLKLGRLEKKD